MLKQINCPFGETITIYRRNADEVATINISREHETNLGARLASENHLEIIEALLNGLNPNDLHKCYELVVAAFPEHMRWMYDPRPGHKKPL